jgi:hypothetical protein
MTTRVRAWRHCAACSDPLLILGLAPLTQLTRQRCCSRIAAPASGNEVAVMQRWCSSIAAAWARPARGPPTAAATSTDSSRACVCQLSQSEIDRLLVNPARSARLAQSTATTNCNAPRASSSMDKAACSWPFHTGHHHDNASACREGADVDSPCRYRYVGRSIPLGNYSVIFILRNSCIFLL